MSRDYSKLEGKIVEVYKTRSAFAKAMEMAEETLSRKLNCRSAFNSDEICKACDLLGIKPKDIPTFFFTVDSQ